MTAPRQVQAALAPKEVREIMTLDLDDGLGTEVRLLADMLESVETFPKPVAERLLEAFGSLSGVLRAGLVERWGLVSKQGNVLLASIQEAMDTAALQTVKRSAVTLSNSTAATDYFRTIFAGRRTEAMVVLYLDNKNRVLDSTITPGTIDSARVYPREIMRRMVLLDATAVLMAHNHPSGDPTASVQDIAITKAVKKALAVIGCHLHDHMVFGDGAPYSLKAHHKL